MVETEKLLVVNRGEGARRVIHTARKLGIPTATVFTPDDEKSLHVRDADEAHKIKSYEDVPGAIKIAKGIGAKMIHPVWGFESENPKFPRACDKAGIIFIGPSVEAMKKAGNKENIKRIAKKLVIPGIESSSRVKRSNVAKWAADHGLSDQDDSAPMMIKAARAGGGVGNALVFNLKDLNGTVEILTKRSKSRIFVERFIKDARHVEAQLVGDQNNNLVYLGTRDCTVQYRNQKVIEEAPAPFLTLEQEKLLQDYSLAIGREIEYSSAGTVEFLIAPDGEIYFMEFNPRLQVEHGITELITNLDLVEQQIRIAEGNSLPFTQQDVDFYGVAIEARVNSQTIDPNNPYKLMPAPGVVEEVIFPQGRNVRVDHALYNGYEINPKYNSTQAKVMVWNSSREGAVNTLYQALEEFVIRGIETNIPLLLSILSDSRFLKGEHTTTFFEGMLKEMAENKGGKREDKERAAAIGVALVIALQEKQKRQEETVVFSQGSSLWRRAGRIEQTNRRIDFRGRR